MGFINPRVDVAFKKIFGVEENSDILISLLNSIVSEEDQVDEIELLNPYNERNFKQSKLTVLDIKARNKHTKTYFLIEMQLADEMEYPKRSLYSWARVYSNQLTAGQHYRELKKTIAIHILNFTFIDYKKQLGWIETIPNKYHHRFVLSDKETRVEIFKDIEIHTIELNKFAGIHDENLVTIVPKVKDMLDKWVAVLTKYELLNSQDLPKEIDLPEIQKALQIMQNMTMNPDEREVYEDHQNFLRIQEGALEKRYIEGIEEGIQIGEARGVEQGKVEAIASIVMTLHQAGQSIEFLSKLTGLSAAQIQQIIGSIK